MNDEIKDTPETTPETEKAAEEPKIKPITVELDDLSEDGRKRIAERLGRPVEDLPYNVLSQQPRPGSGLIMRIEVERKVFLEEEERLLQDIGKESRCRASQGARADQLFSCAWAKTPSATRSARWRPTPCARKRPSRTSTSSAPCA